jgi:hypothetical protein
MAVEIHVWKLTALSPLLQNNPASTMTSTGDDSLSAKKKTYDDDEEAEIRTYKADDGTFYHPSASLRSAVLEAAKGRKIGKKAARAIISGALFPAEERITICNGDGKPAKKFAVHKCRVKIGKAGILRCRPMFENWSAKVPFEVESDLVTPSLVTDLLNVAGRIIGIGDNRPDTSGGKTGVGGFGRFKAELVR